MLERAHVAVEVAHVEAPHDRPLDLRPALPADLVEICVVPRVLDRAGEAAIAVEQARRLGDRSPPVRLPLRVQGEVHADVLAPVLGGGVTRPGARHHQRGARRDAVAQRVVYGDVGRTRRAEVVAVDDEQLGVGCIAETLGESGHLEKLLPDPSLVGRQHPCQLLEMSFARCLDEEAGLLLEPEPHAGLRRRPARPRRGGAATARRRRGACRSGWARGRRPRRGCGRH